MRLRLNSWQCKSSSSAKNFPKILFSMDGGFWKSHFECGAVMFFIFMWVILPITMLWAPWYVLFFTRWWFLVPLYLVWFAYDFKTPRLGSRPMDWIRRHNLWNYFADYFPLRLVKTYDLSPDRNYIIGSHPHGVFSVGAYTTFCTNATGFHEKFPGIKPTILTLNGQFYFPLRREFGTLVGGTESSKESLQYSLTNRGKGNACGIVIGGAMESLDAHPNRHILTIKSRRGFCKYALIHGADLVPLYHFGENDLYEQYDNPKGSHLRKIQERILKVWGICPPLLRGCSLFSKSIFGLMPHRKPVTSVVGKPIRVNQTENPTQEQIDELHRTYCEALYNLFEEYKHLHGIPMDQHLEFQ